MSSSDNQGFDTISKAINLFGQFSSCRWQVRLALFAVFFLVAESDLYPKSRTGIDKSKQVEIYLDYAFAESSVLRKFEFSPVLSMVCKDSSYCLSLQNEFAPFIPSFTTTKIRAVYEPKDEISVFSELEDFQLAVQSITPASNSTVFSWGRPECSVVQLVNQNTVLQLLIYVDKNEGTKRNSICLTSELAVGSGGGRKSDYHQLVKFFESSKYSTYGQVQTLFLISLHYHWSTLLAPGLNRKESESVLQEYLNQTR